MLCNATRRLGDGKRVILCQRVQGSVRAISAVWHTRVFLKETRVVADEIAEDRKILGSLKRAGKKVEASQQQVKKK